MRVFVIRHGESLANLDVTAYERNDPTQIKLSRWGYEQSVEAGQFLKQLYAENPELKGRKLRIYHSPHLRTRQTSDGIVSALKGGPKCSVRSEPLLEERDYGAFDRITSEADWQRTHPDVYADLHSPDYRVRYETKMPGGESLKDVAERSQKFVEKIKREVGPDEDVVVITHGKNCRALEMTLVPRNVQWYVESRSAQNADIMQVDPGESLEKQGHGVVIHASRKRTASTPKDFKTEAYDGKAHIRQGTGGEPLGVTA